MIKRPLLLILFLLTLFSCNQNYQTEEFSFIQISDPHWVKAPSAESGFPDLISRINRSETDIDFVVLTGDFLNNGEFESKFFDFGYSELKRLKYPIHVLPGNHDIRVGNERVFQRTVEQFTSAFGPLISFADYKGVRCIYAYISSVMFAEELFDYSPFEEIDKILTDSTKMPVILFIHDPPIKDHINGYQWDSRTIEHFAELIRQHDNVQAIITGHWHEDAMGWIDDVPVYVSDAAYSRYIESEKAKYRIYNYKSGRLSYRTITLDIIE